MKANPEGMKWPTDKARYDKNYLKLFGKQCPKCKGEGWLGIYICSKCNGIGWVEKQ